MYQHGDYVRRARELAKKLEERASTCKGLYPVRGYLDFLRIACDRLKTPDVIEPGRIGELDDPHIQELCDWLEGMLREPETSHQINALSQIRRGVSSPFTAVPPSEERVLEG